MKRLKYLVLATLAIGGLLLPLAATRPQTASAGNGCGGLAFGFFVPFGAGLGGCPEFGADTSCTLSNVIAGTLSSVKVSATADGNKNSYTYDVSCDTGGNVHVYAAYDFSAGKAAEYLRSADFSLSAAWDCSHDPWVAPSPQSCTRTGANGGPTNGGTVYDVEGIDLSQHDGPPFSAAILGDQGRQTLFYAQLQFAAAHPPPPAPTPAPLRVVGTTTNVLNNCTVCSVLGATPTPAPAPTLPDFKVPNVGGDKNLAQGISSVYSFAVSNMGTKPATQVQVSIQVTGAIQYLAMTQTPAGWDCSGSGPITCVGPLGGYGDTVQSQVAAFQIQVRGVNAGVGAITVAADPNSLIQESDETNNTNQIVVTVK